MGNLCTILMVSSVFRIKRCARSWCYCMGPLSCGVHQTVIVKTRFIVAVERPEKMWEGCCTLVIPNCNRQLALSFCQFGSWKTLTFLFVYEPVPLFFSQKLDTFVWRYIDVSRNLQLRRLCSSLPAICHLIQSSKRCWLFLIFTIFCLILSSVTKKVAKIYSF